MRTNQSTVLEALRRSQEFLDANPELLEEVNKSNARRKLDAVTAQLATYGVSQDGSARASSGETAKQRSLAADLRIHHMRPIARIARRLLSGRPEFESLRLPPVNIGALKLVAKAGGMAEAAAPHAELLMAEGLGPKFLDELQAARTALSESLTGRDSHRRNRVGSTKGLSEEEKNGRMILSVLDSAVRKRLKLNAPLLAEWNMARQPRRVSRPASGTTPVDTTPVATPTVATTPTTDTTETSAPSTTTAA